MRLVRGIPADEITTLWPRLQPLISRALDRSQDYTLDDVHQSLREERRQCFATWPEIDTICITSIEIRPARKVLIIWWKAGRLHSDWHQMLQATENWGRSLGCTRIEFRGRKGWEKLLPRGYETDTIYWKELKDG